MSRGVERVQAEVSIAHTDVNSTLTDGIGFGCGMSGVSGNLSGDGTKSVLIGIPGYDGGRGGVVLATFLEMALVGEGWVFGVDFGVEEAGFGTSLSDWIDADGDGRMDEVLVGAVLADGGNPLENGEGAIVVVKAEMTGGRELGRFFPARGRPVGYAFSGFLPGLGRGAGSHRLMTSRPWQATAQDSLNWVTVELGWVRPVAAFHDVQGRSADGTNEKNVADHLGSQNDFGRSMSDFLDNGDGTFSVVVGAPDYGDKGEVFLMVVDADGYAQENPVEEATGITTVLTGVGFVVSNFLDLDGDGIKREVLVGCESGVDVFVLKADCPWPYFEDENGYCSECADGTETIALVNDRGVCLDLFILRTQVTYVPVALAVVALVLLFAGDVLVQHIPVRSAWSAALFIFLSLAQFSTALLFSLSIPSENPKNTGKSLQALAIVAAIIPASRALIFFGLMARRRCPRVDIDGPKSPLRFLAPLERALHADFQELNNVLVLIVVVAILLIVNLVWYVFGVVLFMSRIFVTRTAWAFFFSAITRPEAPPQNIELKKKQEPQKENEDEYQTDLHALRLSEIFLESVPLIVLVSVLSRWDTIDIVAISIAAVFVAMYSGLYLVALLRGQNPFSEHIFANSPKHN